MQRRKLAMVVILTGGLLGAAGLAWAQQGDGVSEPLAKDTPQPATPAPDDNISADQALEAERNKPFDDTLMGPPAPPRQRSTSLEEIELLTRLKLTVPAGTRWQIERPLAEHRIFVVISPPPPDLKRQLAPYRAMSGLVVQLERASDQLAVLRLEQARHDLGPVLVHVGQHTRTGKLVTPDALDLYATPRGVMPEDGVMEIMLGRLRRLVSSQSLCRFLRTPLEASLSDSEPELEQFLKAEEKFLVGEDDEANAIYKTLAVPLHEAHNKSGAGRVTRGVTLGELAALRMSDVQVCRGALRSARLRYEMLNKGDASPVVKLLAGFKWVQLVYPEVDQQVIRSLQGELPDKIDNPLVARIFLHAVRVLLQNRQPAKALEMFTHLTATNLSWLPPRELQALRHRTLSEAVQTMLRRDDKVALAVMGREHQAMVFEHPRALTMAIEIGTALRALGLPDQSVLWFQEAMEKVAGGADDSLLLAELARSYRESNDLYRAEKTIRFLVERLKRHDGWLGRREEISISLAATAVALDARKWASAVRWLERAKGLGAGPSIEALRLYVQGRVEQDQGRAEAAARSMLRAAAMRGQITPFRRAEVCLKAAEAAADAGQMTQAVSLLRIFMAEVQNDDMEVEVGFALAQLLERGGQRHRAVGLFEDIALKQPDGTYGRLASHNAKRLTLLLRHQRLLGALEPGPKGQPKEGSP